MKVANYHEGDVTVLTADAQDPVGVDQARAQELLADYGIIADGAAVEVSVTPDSFVYTKAGAGAMTSSFTYSGKQYVLFGNRLMEISTEGMVEPEPDTTVEVNGAANVAVGGDNAATPQLDPAAAYVGTGQENTLNVEMYKSWAGFGADGRAKDIQTIALTAAAAGALDFSAKGIEGATSYEIKKRRKRPDQPERSGQGRNQRHN